MTTKGGRRGRINRQYFKHKLLDHRLSMRELARMMNLDQSKLVRAFQGQREFKSAEISKMASLLSIPLEEVLLNLGVEVPLRRREEGRTVAVMGSVILGRIHEGVTSGVDTVAAPPNEDADDLQAIHCTDAGPLAGAYLYFRPALDVPPTAIGKLCVCAIKDGDTLLALPAGTPQAGVYTLHDIGGRVLAKGVRLESASRVVWIKAT